MASWASRRASRRNTHGEIKVLLTMDLRTGVRRRRSPFQIGCCRIRLRERRGDEGRVVGAYEDEGALAEEDIIAEFLSGCLTSGEYVGAKEM